MGDWHRRDVTYLMNVSRSPLVCQIFWVFNRRALLMSASVAGIWPLQDHSSGGLRAVEREVAAFPPRPRFVLGAGAGASS